MSKKNDYIKKISLRGDHFGNNGGTYSLLQWCKKINLQQVTEDEAKNFLENPNSDYKDLYKSNNK